MKYCYNCGKKVEENAYVCVSCGVKLKDNNETYSEASDDNSVGFGILGFFVPLAGLIIYFTMKDSKPKSSKSALKGALISIVVNFILVIVVAILGVVFAFNSTDNWVEDTFDDFHYGEHPVFE